MHAFWLFGPLASELIAFGARHSDKAQRNPPRLLDLLQGNETRNALGPDLRGEHVIHDLAIVIDVARDNLEHRVETTADEITLDNELLIAHVTFELLRVLVELLRVLDSSLAQRHIRMDRDM